MHHFCLGRRNEVPPNATLDRGGVEEQVDRYPPTVRFVSGKKGIYIYIYVMGPPLL